jgi:hypothetical protein
MSIPAAVRRRWRTSVVVVEDHGDSLVVRPVPDDPIEAAHGILKGRLPSTGELRAAARRDEEYALRRRA